MPFDGPPQASSVSANIERFTGFARTYHENRPIPPEEVIKVLKQWSGIWSPHLVVDLGSGTGLSTRLWLGHARRIIGIEPNSDMRLQAAMADSKGEISFRPGLSTDTGLEDGCSDMVFCSQALHWMEPTGTFREIARILRPRGVFAACDVDWPPTMHWKVDAAYRELEENVARLEKGYACSSDVRHWPKHEHLERMTSSGYFAFCREVLLHKTEPGSADRLLGLALSQGGVASLLKHGLTPDEIGLTKLHAAAREIMGETTDNWYFSYRIRMGVKR